VVGGAAPLLVPGTARRALDDPDWVPVAIRKIAAASLHQLDILQATSVTDWTYLAPAALFEPGPRTGTYRTGGKELVIDADGRSYISMEDYAIALLDEIETPTARLAVLSTGY
jgi:putative NADH-flavin reductase